uniref:Uncharacterized protein n=1 Tax=Tetradesmus obliquus TaxID=3088 RepID=A0A383VVF4_TETOB|eukprot:jgi/Sobl393_1/8604/SZX68890.1
MIMDMLKGPIVMLQAVGQRRITLSFTVKHVMLVLMLAAMAMATVLLLRFYWQDMLKGFMMLQAVWQPPITITITTTTGKIILLLMLVATAKAIVDAAKKLFSLRMLTHTAEKKVCLSQVPVHRAANGRHRWGSYQESWRQGSSATRRFRGGECIPR